MSILYGKIHKSRFTNSWSNHKKLFVLYPAILVLVVMFSFSSMAADGRLDWASRQVIAGWAWDEKKPDEAAEVLIEITPAGSDQKAATLTTSAGSYRGDIETEDRDGYHGFFCTVDWSQFTGQIFTIRAYVNSDGKKVLLPGVITYDRSAAGAVAADAEPAEINGTGTVIPVGPGGASDTGKANGTSAPDTGSTSGTGASDSEKKTAGQDGSAADQKSDGPTADNTQGTSAGPGETQKANGPTAGGDSAAKAAAPGNSAAKITAKTSGPAGPGSPAAPASASGMKKGVSLGIFSVTGYCNCDICSKGWKLTASGTVPQANHTISADTSMFPFGTKLMIDDIVYTVEDRGGGVKGNVIDIYFASHEEAIAYTKKNKEVFTVIEE